MPERLSCPNLDELHQFLLGRLPADQTDRLQDHLAHCAPCLDTVAGLKAEDTLVGAWRAQADAAASSEDQQVAALIQKLSGLLPLPDATAVASGASTAPAWVEPREFLAPPLNNDEIGRLGPYRVLKVLGVGGMGIVFDADDPQLKRHVALKVMKPELAQDVANRHRFLREAQAAAAIEHDHIVTIHQVGEDRGIPFLAMQLLKGETLEERLTRIDGASPPALLSTADVLRVGREVAEGLAAAHAQGLTHRDIKPANVWLEKNGRVKILDFGLARPQQDDAHLTQTGLIAGTPQYMAPEQAAGHRVDHLSDLFSLGCVLYRLLTGRLPFAGPTTLAVLRALALEQPPPPHVVNRDVPPALSDLTMRLLAKDPRDRPQSAEEVLQELAKIERALEADARRAESKPHPAPTGRGGRFAVIGVLLLLTAGPLVAWYAPTIYRIATNQGLLVIETEDRDVEVAVKQNGELIKLVDLKTGREVTLKAGVYQLELSGDKKHGLKLETDHFTLKRGGREIARVRREHSPAPVSNPASATPPGSPALPFVIVARDGRAEQKLATLAEAVAGAQTGDVIEVRGQTLPVRQTVRIRGKALTIRAATGFRPVVQLVTETGEARLTQLNTDAALVLEGLEIQRAGAIPDKPVNYWCVASYHAPLRLVNCRFVFPAHPGFTAAVYFDGSPMGEMRHCDFVLGLGCGWCDWICPTDGRMVLEGNVVAGSGGGFVLHHSNPELKGVTLLVTRNTLSNSPLVVALDVSPPEASGQEQGDRPIRIETLENVWGSSPGLQFHQNQAKHAPEAKVFTAPEEAEALLRRLVTWREQRNLYSDAINFLSVGVYRGPLEPIRKRTNLAEWQEFWGQPATGSQQGRIRFAKAEVFAALPQAIETVSPRDFRLQPTSAGFQSGESGRDLGADVDLVGPGEPYERWKKTPAYQEWLNAVGKVP